LPRRLLKVAAARLWSSALLRFGASLESARAVESAADCIAVWSEDARL
jgi:hypothetical protein